jgi:NAD(P)H-dependent FMN reductase
MIAPRLLLVCHSRTGMASLMADALVSGVTNAAREMGGNVDLVRRAARDATTQDVLAADGYLFCAPENLASLSGEMKEFFDRCYYPAFRVEDAGGDYTEVSKILGRPYGLAISAGSDGTLAARQTERICAGWRLRPVADSIIVKNGLTQTKQNILAPKAPLEQDSVDQLQELGGLVAATVLL